MNGGTQVVHLPAAMEGIYAGDALPALREIPDGVVNLIYIDPPFGTGQVQRLQRIKTGSTSPR